MQKIFTPLKPHIIKALQDLPKALDAVLPLQAKHRRTLPYAIEELSSRLTVERGLIKQAYWSAPRLTAAYMWYFLPWNILRLTRLLSSLHLPEPKPMPTRANGKVKPRVFVDMGSGPLSLPIALWLAKPEWREYELNVLCLDTSPHPLQLGQKLFTAIAGEQSPWRIIPVRAQLETAHVEIHKVDGLPWLISAANVCNELKLQEERAYKIMENLKPNLRANDASLLIIEPGTRLGGKTIVTMREAAIEHELNPISPCPHLQECPLEETRTWCHFTFDVSGSPKWLNDLSAAAKLRKDALSLAFVLLSNTEPKDDSNKARIISAPFKVPTLLGESRYACCSQGLALLGNATDLPSGALVELKQNQNQGRTDSKSGAIILEHAEKITQAPRAEYARPAFKQGAKPSAQIEPKAKETKTKEQKQKAKKVIKSKKTSKKFWEQ